MNDVNATLEAADIAVILEALPHRYPFLMIDRIFGMRGDEVAIGIKNVTVNEPQFLGHFPGQPVFPGVLMIEGMAQTAGVLCIRARGKQKPPKAVFFLTVDKAKFRRPVVPGDTLRMEIKILKRKASVAKMSGIATVDGKVVAEAEVMCKLADRDEKPQAAEA